jgi:hypothetical protein
MVMTAGFGALNRCRNHPQGLSNCSWNLVYWCMKISLNEQALLPSFEHFGCSATAKGAMDKPRPQTDSAHQIGLETSLVAFLILGW